MRLARNRTFNRLVCLLVIEFQVTLGLTVRAQEGPHPPLDAVSSGELKRYKQELRRHFGVLEAAAREIRQDTYDPRAVVVEVGKEPRKLLEWVRDHTYWTPYRGALRGHLGVQMDRLGNSVDRALLLAELLRQAGHDVRLARAELTESQGQALLSRLRVLPDEPLPAPTEEMVRSSEATAARLAQQFGLDAAELRRARETRALEIDRLFEQVAESIAEQTERLRATLQRDEEAAGESLRAQLHAAEVAAIRDHWWVQVHEGDSWADLDPALPGLDSGGAGEAIAPAVATFAPEKPGQPVRLPGRFCQEITVRIVVERLHRGKLEEAVALTRVLRPSELYSSPIVLTHKPLHWPEDMKLLRAKEPLQRLKVEALKETEWLPILRIGSEVSFEKSFDQSGNLHDVRLGPANEFASTQKDAVDALTRRLNHLVGDDQKPEAHCVSEWIEFVITTPGREPRTIRRPVFDLLGPDARSSGSIRKIELSENDKLTRALATLSEVHLFAQVCRLSPAFIAHLTSQRMLANRETLLGMLRADVVASLDSMQDQMRKFVRGHHGRLMLLAMARQDASPFRHSQYFDVPNILAYETGLAVSENSELSVFEGFDIITNEIGVPRTSAAPPFLVNLTQGVLDSSLEALLVPGRESGLSTTALFHRSGARPLEWVMIRSVAELKEAQLAITADARKLVEQDLGAGYAVVVPTRRVEFGRKLKVGWWRVNPATGATLGMMENGKGSSITEYMIHNQARWPFYVGTGLGWVGCAGIDPTGNSWKKNLGCAFCALVTGLCLQLAWAAKIYPAHFAIPECAFNAALGTLGGCALVANL